MWNDSQNHTKIPAYLKYKSFKTAVTFLLLPKSKERIEKKI